MNNKKEKKRCWCGNELFGDDARCPQCQLEAAISDVDNDPDDDKAWLRYKSLLREQ